MRTSSEPPARAAGAGSVRRSARCGSAAPAQPGVRWQASRRRGHARSAQASARRVRTAAGEALRAPDPGHGARARRDRPRSLARARRRSALGARGRTRVPRARGRARLAGRAADDRAVRRPRADDPVRRGPLARRCPLAFEQGLEAPIQRVDPLPQREQLLAQPTMDPLEVGEAVFTPSRRRLPLGRLGLDPLDAAAVAARRAHPRPSQRLLFRLPPRNHQPPSSNAAQARIVIAASRRPRWLEGAIRRARGRSVPDGTGKQAC